MIGHCFYTMLDAKPLFITVGTSIDMCYGLSSVFHINEYNNNEISDYKRSWQKASF